MLFHRSPADWQRWRAGRAGALRNPRGLTTATVPLAIFSESVDAPLERPVVVAVESPSPTQIASLLRPEAVLRARGVPSVVLAPMTMSEDLARRGLCERRRVSGQGLLSDLAPRAVLATTQCASAGGVAWQWARAAGVPYFVVQHGVVTPFAPPLPERCRLLAWSEQDARFWVSGRRDVAWSVVGSQILWQASHSRSEPSASDGATCFLGQLHGAELTRAVTLRTVTTLARRGPLVYRPHPDETDLQSRCWHCLWRMRGIAVDAAPGSLAGAGGPVAGIFSTGILEAAALGRDAYAFCVRPPYWLEEFWHRYQMAPLGASTPTLVEIADFEPAVAVAEAVEALR